MWLGKAAMEQIHDLRIHAGNWQADFSAANAKRQHLEIENARLRADLDWFKLRLNQVERERGQLIQAAIGVKIAVPEFVPTYEDPGKALSEVPDMSTVGHDARDDGGAPMQTSADPGEGVDFSMMPGYTGDRR